MRFTLAKYYLKKVIEELNRNMRKYSPEDKEKEKQKVKGIRRAIIELKNREK